MFAAFHDAVDMHAESLQLIGWWAFLAFSGIFSIGFGWSVFAEGEAEYLPWLVFAVGAVAFAAYKIGGI